MNLEILAYIIVAFIFVFVIFAVISARVIYKQYIRTKHLNNFENYIALLEYHMVKAYDIIHKDRILVYSLDAMRLPDEEFNAISHDFVNLVFKLIGPSLYKEFVNMYGNQDTLIFNLVEYFNTRYEEDEIRKNTLGEISNPDQPEEMINEIPIGSIDGTNS